MHQLRKLIQITPYLALLCLGGCGSKESGGTVEKADMFPPPSAFGANCVVDEQISDAMAVEIAKGVFKDPGVMTAGNSNVIQCLYKNPDLIMTVSHFEDAKACELAHAEDGIGVARSLKDFREFDGIGEDGYLSDFGGENFGFRWGNLSVVVNRYNKDDRDKIVAALKSHFEVVTK